MGLTNLFCATSQATCISQAKVSHPRGTCICLQRARYSTASISLAWGTGAWGSRRCWPWKGNELISVVPRNLSQNWYCFRLTTSHENKAAALLLVHFQPCSLRPEIVKRHAVQSKQLKVGESVINPFRVSWPRERSLEDKQKLPFQKKNLCFNGNFAGGKITKLNPWNSGSWLHQLCDEFSKLCCIVP